MNRSVPDLLEALRPDREDPVEPAAFLLETARRRRRRRARQSVLAAGLSATAAVLVLAGLPVVLARSSTAPAASRQTSPARPQTASAGPTTSPPAPTTPRRSRPVLSQTLRASTATPWVITPYTADEWFQLAYVNRPDRPKSGGEVIVFEPGAFNPTEMLGGTPTTVGGHRGYYHFFTDPFSGDEQGDHRNMEPAIAWQYAPDAWAVVHGTFGEVAPEQTDPTVPTTLRRVANAVVIGPATPVKVPFKLGYVPPGIHPVAVGISQPGYAGGGFEFDRDDQPHDWLDPYRWETSPLSVGMTAAIPRQWKPDTTLGGAPAMTNGDNQIILQRDGYWLSIGNGIHTTPLPRSEIEHIFATMTFANFADHATWFDAADAIPQ